MEWAFILQGDICWNYQQLHYIWHYFCTNTSIAYFISIDLCLMCIPFLRKFFDRAVNMSSILSSVLLFICIGFFWDCDGFIVSKSFDFLLWERKFFLNIIFMYWLCSMMMNFLIILKWTLILFSIKTRSREIQETQLNAVGKKLFLQNEHGSVFLESGEESDEFSRYIGIYIAYIK